MKHIRNETNVPNPWSGIPELTNRDNRLCVNSCPTQAWSVSTLIEGIYDVFTDNN